MAIHRFPDRPEPQHIDHDFIAAAEETLQRSLSAISIARLQAAQQALDMHVPENLASSFQFADQMGFSQKLVNTCAQLSSDKVDIEERLMILTELPQDKIIKLAKLGILNPVDVFLTVAFIGSDEELAQAWDELFSLKHENRQEILDMALSLCAYAQELDNGCENEVNADKVHRLIELGANVNAPDLWDQVSESQEREINALFVRAGADAGCYLDAIDKERYAFSYMIKSVLGVALYTRRDEQTLVQVVFAQPVDFKNRVETIYRFDLGQVTEVHYMGHEEPQEMHRTAFAEVPLATLELMREKLQGLGGTPLSLASVARTVARAPLIKPQR